MRDMSIIQAVIYVLCLLMTIAAFIGMLYNPIHIIYALGLSCLTHAVRKSW